MTTPRAPRSVLADGWRRSLNMLADHLPLLVGTVAMAVVHGLRDWIVPSPVPSWMKPIDRALFVAEYTMLFGLVLPNAVNLMVELAEIIAVGIHRIKQAYRTGVRLPRTD